MTALEMLFTVMLVVGLHLSSGLDQRKPNFGAIDLRHYCATQHFRNTYKVSCDGSKHFKNKNLTLDSRSVFGITYIELYAFENVNIISQTSLDWVNVNKIIIRNCIKVFLNVQSTIQLNEFEVDSTNELTIVDDGSDYSVNARKIQLSNIGKLNLPNSSNAKIKSSVLTLINMTDVTFAGQLKSSGELLTIKQSNIDLTEHSVAALKFFSVIIKDSTKLNIQECGQLDVSANFFFIKESYIYISGNVNITGYEYLEKRKIVKFLKNSIYGMRKSDLNISGDNNEVNFTGNGIYRSDIGDLMGFIGEMEGVTFKSNRFGCNQCTDNRQLFQARYQQDIGVENFCDLTCNLTLTGYKALLDQEKICNSGKYEDDHILCSGGSDKLTISHGGLQSLWFLVPVIFGSLLCVSYFLYSFLKRNSPRFQPIPVDNVILPQLTNIQGNQQVTSRAFDNELYAQVDNNPDNNIYETVDNHSS